MKIRNPKSRYDIKIKKQDLVLDIGGGHNPHPKANVIVDNKVEDNSHRGGDLSILNGQKFIEADGHNLPFKDNSFDYAVCCHVVEHVEDPVKFVGEMTRVAKKGYLEVPSLIGEYLAPKYSHKWVSLEIDGKLVFFEKSKLNLPEENTNFGDVFLYFLRSNSLAYKLLLETNPNLLTTRIEWEGDLEVIVNPEESVYRDYFTQPWNMEMITAQLQKKSMLQDLLDNIQAFGKIFKSVVQSTISGNRGASFEQMGLGEAQKEASLKPSLS